MVLDLDRDAQLHQGQGHLASQVLVLIARGMSNSEIATSLGISLDTVKSHIKHVFLKLHVRDRAQAVIAAYEGGLIEPSLGS